MGVKREYEGYWQCIKDIGLASFAMGYDVLEEFVLCGQDAMVGKVVY